MDISLNNIGSRLPVEGGDEKMALLTQKDLTVLARTKAKIKAIYLVPVDADGKRHYEIHLDVEGKSGIEHCQMITAKNEPQRWSSLNRVVEMLEKYTDHPAFIVVSAKPKENEEQG
jgi:hypothetical protein